MKPISLSDFKKTSANSLLKEFYARMATETNFGAMTTELRFAFLRKTRGEFLAILRQRLGMTIEEVAKKNGLTVIGLENIEQGAEGAGDDSIFFRLCGSLNANQEVSVFLERLEDVVRPGTHAARRDVAKSLKQYGICFADPSINDDSPMGLVLSFPKKKS